jgi:hypothetical protein
MKIKFALILLLAASLAACSSTVQTTQAPYDKSAAYAQNSVEPGSPGTFEPDIPAEGPAPADLQDSPAYIPTPLLRQMAASSP